MMNKRTIAQFFSDLKSLDVQLFIEGDCDDSSDKIRLRCSAPEGTLKGELRQELADRKAELVAYLQQLKSQSVEPISTIQTTDRETVFPMSFAQQRLWFLDRLAPDNPFYNVPAAIRLMGTVDRTALERSIDEIARRHAALRTTFTTLDGQPVQVVESDVKVQLSVVNLPTVAASDRQRIGRQLAAAEAQRPFNLTTDPLLRVTLVQFDLTEAVLLLTMHHIVADGWSLGVWLQELAEFYTAFVEKRTPLLPPLPIQYTDFACWQRNWLQGKILEEQLTYWRKQLQDLPMLELPSDRPRKAVQSYRGATYPLQISPTLTQALEALSQQSGASLFMTLLAAFQTLLYRYTGQEDIAIGSPIANRHRSELEGLIGFFVNSLVLRSNLSGNPTFRELLARVRDVALEAYEHQDLPFEKLVEELDPDRDLARNPLFQVAFALQNAPMQPLELPGLTLEPAPLASASTRFDLEVHLWEPGHGLRSLWQSQEGLSGFISYSTDLFDRDRIDRLIGHFQTLLEGIAANPDARLSDLPMLSIAEIQQILFEWNRSPLTPLSKGGKESELKVPLSKGDLGGSGSIEPENQSQLKVPLLKGDLGGSDSIEQENQSQLKVPLFKGSHCDLGVPPNEASGVDLGGSGSIEPLCFHQIFEAQVRSNPEAIAIVSEQESLTYSELDRLADRLAQTLRQMGIQPDSLVGLCVDRSTDMAIGILGILKSGGAYVPLDPNYPRDRLDFMLSDTQVSILLTQSWLVERLPRSPANILCLDREDRPAFITPVNQESNLTVTADNLAYVIYTSGSTGTPKGVLLSHRGLCNVVVAQQQLFDLSGNSRILQFSSLSFDASIFEIALAFGCGGALYIPPKSARLPGMELVQFLKDNAITHALLTPAVLAVLPPAELPALQVLITGGETCSPQAVDRWAANRHFFNAYGPTETTIWATVAKLCPGDNPLAIGHPVLNTQVYILDANLNLVPAGIPGELYIGGTGVARGYLNRKELTAERFIDLELNSEGTPNPKSQIPNLKAVRVYKTGDRARYQSDGTIEFLGRSDNQIKIRGFRVELGEIEAILQRHPAVRDAVAIASEETSDRMRLIAYLSLDRQYLQQTIRESLAAQQIQQWQTLYAQTYQSTNNTENFNITGWSSSYSGQPIPLEQMQEWASDRAGQILALKPKRVLEIGCGTGLLLFQIAPHCQKYTGTDFSIVALESIQNQLDDLHLPQVELLHRMATDFEGIDSRSFDVAILNSIVQYFPSVDYLMQVLEKAIETVAPGGVLFVGDVRSLPMLTAFHSWVQFCQADAGMERNQLQQRVMRARFEEPELTIDPAFFYALRDRFPQIKQVQIRLSRGRSQNEMTQFRYNVLLHLERSPCDRTPHFPNASPTNSEVKLDSSFSYLRGDEFRVRVKSADSSNLSNPIQQHNWQLNPISIEEIQKNLSETKPEILIISNVTNSRVNAAVKTANWLHDLAAPKTVGRMREVLDNSTSRAIDPQDWWDLETVLPYNVEITWSTQTHAGDYDVLLIRRDVNAIFDSSIPQQLDRSWHQYTNDPLQSQFARQLIPQLRQYLGQSLPEYAIPSAFVPLETLPVTANGKVDRRALPIFTEDLIRESCTTRSQLTQTESTLIEIWKELLRLKQVNARDNFFELGGHSLLATQMTSRVRDVFGLELPLKSVFEAPTIAQLACIIEALHDNTLTPKIPPLVRLDRSAYRRSRSLLPDGNTQIFDDRPLRASPTSDEPVVTPNRSVIESRSPLVPLTLGGSKPPFFCVHPMFGVVFPYLELAHHLGSDRSFYGLQALGLDGKSAPHDRIEAMAACYIQAIKMLQPNGPYFLGGWSFGGLVAFEMAQQLTQSGQQVALLAILDTPAPCNKPSLSQSLQFLLGTALQSALPFLLDYGTLAANRLQSLTGWFSRWQLSAIASLIPEESRLQLLDESAIAPMLRIVYANARAAYRYVPQQRADRIVLFKATEQSDAIGGDRTLGWSAFSNNIQVHQVPGNHLSLLKQPHVPILAQQLKQYL